MSFQEPEFVFPEPDESMVEFLSSDRFKQASGKITFSSLADQDKSNYRFWSKLTPLQRLELHYIQIQRLPSYNTKLTQKPDSFALVFSP